MTPAFNSILQDLVKGAQSAGANVKIHQNQGHEIKLANLPRNALTDAFNEGVQAALDQHKVAFIGPLLRAGAALARPLFNAAKPALSAVGRGATNLMRNPAVRQAGTDFGIQTAANHFSQQRQQPRPAF